MNKQIKFLCSCIIALLLIVAMNNVIYATTEEENYFRDFTGLYLVDDEIYLEDNAENTIEVEIYGNSDIKYISTSFFNFETGESFQAELVGRADGSSRAYLLIPNTVKTNMRYEMMYVNVTSADGTVLTYATTQGAPGFMNTFGRKYITVKKTEKQDIKLKALEFEKTDINIDKEELPKVSKLDIEGDSSNYDLISVVLKNDYGNTFGPGAIYTEYSGKINLNLYSSTMKIVKGTTYYITDIYILKNGNIVKHYVTPKANTGSGADGDVELYSKDIVFNMLDTSKPAVVLEEIEENDFTLNKLVLKNDAKNLEVKLNEKVEIDLNYECKSKVKSIMISFYNNSKSEMIPVYLKAVNEKRPYFIVPYNAKPGDYELNYAIFETEDGKSYHYRKGTASDDIKHYDFNSTIKIKQEISSNSDNTLDFINDKIENNLDIIKNVDENTVITINANKNSTVKKEIFEAIKGRNVTIRIISGSIEWVINGKDVNIIKDIDVNVHLSKIGEKENSSILGISKGYMLSFAANGYLPGKTLIRVKMNDLTNENLSQKRYNAYYYDEASQKLDKVAINKIVSDDGYFEFYINHNSSFVLSEDEASKEYVSEKVDDLELNSSDILVQKTDTENDVLGNSESSENTVLTENNILKVVIIVLVVIIIAVVIKNVRSKKSE